MKNQDQIDEATKTIKDALSKIENKAAHLKQFSPFSKGWVMDDFKLQMSNIKTWAESVVDEIESVKHLIEP